MSDMADGSKPIENSALPGVSRFQGKVAVVAGAEHPLGASLCERLARFGTVVVAMGWCDDTLHQLAAKLPERIEPLALHQGRRDVLALLKEAWESEPLDIYMDLSPLCETGQERQGFAASAGMAQALQSGMRAGKARGIMALPQSSARDTPEAQARTAGYAALMRRLARQAAPARLCGLSLRAEGHDWTVADCLSAGDLMLAMCHDITRGLHPGSIVEWSSCND